MSIRFLLPFLLLPLSASPQSMLDRGHGHAMMREADEALARSDADAALNKLATVNRNDSLYERVVLKRVSILIDENSLSDAERLCRTGMQLKGENSSYFQIMRAAILLDLERPQDAIAACDSAIRELPGNFRVRHIRAKALGKNGDRAGELVQAMDNAKRFPYQRDAHLLLGDIAMSEERLAQAAMAYMMAQIVRFEDPKAESTLIRYDQMLGGTSEFEHAGYDLSPAGDDLADLDLILKSKVAMDKKYKVKPDLAYPTCRQSHVLFTSIAERKNAEPGFYERFYGPLIKAIMDQGRFEGYVYHCLASSTNEQVKSVATKNRAKVDEFRRWLPSVLVPMYQVFPETEGGPSLVHYFNDNEDLLAYGPGDIGAGLNTGDWVAFSPGGRVSGRGSFNSSGKRDGRWEHWNAAGGIETQSDYSNGKYHGMLISYHDIGTKSDSAVLHDDLRDGPTCFYYRMGGTRVCKVGVKGEWDGPVTEYHPAGMVEWTYALKAGKTDGPVRQTRADGSLQYEGTFTNGDRIGKHLEHHITGVPQSEITYVDGKGDGPLLTWHPSGAKKQEATLKAGTIVGERRSFDEWGTLREVERFGENGKLQGLYEDYNPDGTKASVMDYNRGLLMRYTYYSREGKVLSEGTRSKGRFQFKGYNADGGLRVEGIYLDEGLKDGPWKYYQPDGTIDFEEDFDKGKEIGVHKYYDAGGVLARQDEHYEKDGTPYSKFTRQFRSGQAREIGFFKNGTVEGVLRRFFPDGALRSEEYYADGDQLGWQDYFDSKGKRVYSERIDEGAIAERVNYDSEGVEYERILVAPGAFEMVAHYPNGKVMLRLQMMNGWLNGKAAWYYPDGKLETEGAHLNGKKHGAWTSYHPNGKKRSEVSYVLGEEDGSSKRYQADGSLLSETTYRMGREEGVAREFHHTGKISFLREYQHGELHGRVISHTHDGVPQLVRFYHKGQMVAYGSPMADGSVKDTVRLSGGIRQIESHFPDGTLSRRMTYRNGELDGIFEEYHANGQLMEKAEYKIGDVQGTSTEYHANGKVMETIPYVNGVVHGERVVYWDNGQVRERMNYVQGQLHGPWSQHDRTGKRLALYQMRNDDIIRIGE